MSTETQIITLRLPLSAVNVILDALNRNPAGHPVMPVAKLIGEITAAVSSESEPGESMDRE